MAGLFVALRPHRVHPHVAIGMVYVRSLIVFGCLAHGCACKLDCCVCVCVYPGRFGRGWFACHGPLLAAARATAATALRVVLRDIHATGLGTSLAKLLCCPVVELMLVGPVDILPSRSRLAHEKCMAVLSSVAGRPLPPADIVQLVRDHGEAEMANRWRAALRSRNSAANPGGKLAGNIQALVMAVKALPDPVYENDPRALFRSRSLRRVKARRCTDCRSSASTPVCSGLQRMADFDRNSRPSTCASTTPRRMSHAGHLKDERRLFAWAPSLTIVKLSLSHWPQRGT